MLNAKIHLQRFITQKLVFSAALAYMCNVQGCFSCFSSVQPGAVSDQI